MIRPIRTALRRARRLRKVPQSEMSNNQPAKKKVYVETTVVSDATARPSKDLILAGRQILSREWLETARRNYELYTSFLVHRESLQGDAEAAARRLSALTTMQYLEADERAFALSDRLIREKAVPKEYPDDALHIAIAALNAMDYLVSWNFRHITNAQTIPLVKRVCEASGYRCPEICTPQMLQEGDD